MTECNYCGTDKLAYSMKSDRGTVARCIECLAIEQIQQQVDLPFEVWIDRDDVKPPEHPSAPDIEAFDPREHDYKTIQGWATILARLQDDDPILKSDPDAIGAIFEDTRTFVTNIMGDAAYKSPSEIMEDDDA